LWGFQGREEPLDLREPKETEEILDLQVQRDSLESKGKEVSKE